MLTNIPYDKGYKAFFHGDTVPMVFSVLQAMDVKKRLEAFRFGQEAKANAIGWKLSNQGIHLVDYLEEGSPHPYATKGFYSVEPSNPYPADSQMAKEWQRGVNSAYFDNLEKLNAKTDRKPSTGRKSSSPADAYTSLNL
jgi:hypothetical protein